MSSRARFQWLAFITILGFVLAVFYHYVQGFYYSRPYPLNTFLFNPRAFASDLNESRDIARTLDPYFGKSGNYTSNYFPLANIFFYLLAKLRHPAIFIVYALGIIWGLVQYLRSLGQESGFSFKDLTASYLFPFVSYPFLFMLDRANLEGVLFLLCFFGVKAIKKRPALAAILLATAAAFKIYPAILFVLFLPKRQFRPILIGFTYFILSSFAALALFQGGVLKNLNFLLHLGGLADNKYFFSHVFAMQSGVSVFGLLKWSAMVTGVLPTLNLALAASLYKFASVIFLGFTIAYVTFWEREFWKQVMALVIAMLVVPFMSADYKLIQLFVPLYFFIQKPAAHRRDWIYLIFFGLLLIPKQYFCFRGIMSDSLYEDITIAVVIDPLLLLGFFALMVSERFACADTKQSYRPAPSPA